MGEMRPGRDLMAAAGRHGMSVGLQLFRGDMILDLITILLRLFHPFKPLDGEKMMIWIHLARFCLNFGIIDQQDLHHLSTQGWLSGFLAVV